MRSPMSAYMELVRSNAQGELTELERGMHALHSGMDVKAYAESIGRARKTVSNEVLAAKVADAVADMGHDLSDHFRSLTEPHAAPDWLWPKLVADGLTVEQTRRMVAEMKEAVEPPKWANPEAVLGQRRGTKPRTREAWRRAALMSEAALNPKKDHARSIPVFLRVALHGFLRGFPDDPHGSLRGSRASPLGFPRDSRVCPLDFPRDFRDDLPGDLPCCPRACPRPSLRPRREIVRTGG
jgi:hypothetical protein